MNRRSFLKAAAYTAAAFVVPGCARTSGRAQVFMGAGELIAGSTARVPFGLLAADGTPLGGRKASVWVGDDAASTEGREGLSGPFDATYRVFRRTRAGEPEGFYSTTVAIPSARIARLHVETDDGSGSTVFQPKTRATVARAGQAAPAAPTPTVRAPGGVANLCTRAPACDLHELSMHEALRRGRPVVLSIASPKLCTSRMCGPVLEEVLEVRARVPDALYVHAEPFATDNTTQLSRTARAWRLESEPWTFVVSARGTIAAAFEGPVLADEIAAALRTVAV